MESFRSLWRILLFAMESSVMKLLVILIIGWIAYCTIEFKDNPIRWLEVVLFPFAFVAAMFIMALGMALLCAWDEERLRTRGHW